MDLENTEKLIQAVRNRPVLYLLNHPDYKNNTKKLQAWRDIQRELNEEGVPATAVDAAGQALGVVVAHECVSAAGARGVTARHALAHRSRAVSPMRPRPSPPEAQPSRKRFS